MIDSTHTILVVDDDPAITGLMSDFLVAEGFGVETAATAGQALAFLARSVPDCVILDVMLPGESGFDLCRRIREGSDVPILFLSARQEDADKIRGLGLGGDDYIVKSATPSEVVARVKAVLRRAGKKTVAMPPLNFGGLIIDVAAREVWSDGRRAFLTPKEFELLWLLAEHPRQVFTHEALLSRLWEDVGDRHTVTVHIGRIRDKIEPDPSNPRYIATVWGVGYRFEGKTA